MSKYQARKPYFAHEQSGSGGKHFLSPKGIIIMMFLQCSRKLLKYSKLIDIS